MIKVYMNNLNGRGRVKGGKYHGSLLDCRCADRVFTKDNESEKPQVVVTATLYMWCDHGGWLEMLTTSVSLEPTMLLDITDVVYRSAIDKAANEFELWLGVEVRPMSIFKKTPRVSWMSSCKGKIEHGPYHSFFVRHRVDGFADTIEMLTPRRGWVEIVRESRPTEDDSRRCEHIKKSMAEWLAY